MWHFVGKKTVKCDFLAVKVRWSFKQCQIKFQYFYDLLSVILTIFVSYTNNTELHTCIMWQFGG